MLEVLTAEKTLVFQCPKIGENTYRGQYLLRYGLSSCYISSVASHGAHKTRLSRRPFADAGVNAPYPEQYSNLKVIGEAGDGQQALDLISHLQPDVAIMDIRMPKLSGIEVVRQMKELSPITKALA